MAQATLDRLLAILVVALLASGLLTWRAGSDDTVWVYILHGVLGGLLLVAAVLKLRRSTPRAVAQRRWSRLAVASAVAVLTLGSLLVGFASVARGSLVELGPWTLLGWHVAMALLLVPFVLLHLVPRRWRLLKPGFGAGVARSCVPQASRRSVITAGAIAAIGVSVWGAVGLFDLLGGQPRRFTGSRWLSAGGIPRPTTFFGEGVPVIDPAAWRLRVRGRVEREVDLSLDALSALDTTRSTAVLDCTGGWAMETTWHGVSMAAVLDLAVPTVDARRVEVRSITGWAAGLSLDEARPTLLATGVAGIDLPDENGAPCRLVVPNRRGLDWVKWVSEVVVT